MKKILILFMLIVLMTSACAKDNKPLEIENHNESTKIEIDEQDSNPPPEEIEESIEISWEDFIGINGMTYINHFNYTGQDLDIELGEVYGTIELYLYSDREPPLDYMSVNGVSPRHSVGTEVYTITGYNPEFRIAVKDLSGILIYEADNNPNAESVENMLDIRNKVSYISLNTEEDGVTPIYELHDVDKVNSIVESLLDSSLVNHVDGRTGSRYFIEFHLHDETSVIRCFWYENDLIQGGIEIDHMLTEYIINESMAESDKN